MITTLCAWCKKLIRETPSSSQLVSHGICEDCREQFLEQVPQCPNLPRACPKDASEG
jgi:hypothetical protein